MNSNNQTSYRNILRASSLFGGVQVITILISMIRTKFVAIFLGTSGIGTLTLLNAPLNLIAVITGLGISYSAVKDISGAAGSGDEIKVAKVVKSFKLLMIFTGFSGMLIVILMSPLLSKWSFAGDFSYSYAYALLSVTLLLDAISSGQGALLQGMRELKSMAKATVYGSIMGLFTSIPLYYFYGVKGIVPSLIVTSFSSLAISWHYSRQVRIKDISMKLKDVYIEAKNFIKLGIVFSISSQIGNISRYIIISLISNLGGISDVGLYSAGISFMGSYVGLVFTAMAKDYYPRLASLSNDNIKLKTTANQQAVISILLLIPIVVLFLVFLPLIVKIFLSEEFIGIIPFVNLTALGVIIQSVAFPVGYISFAKGDTKFYFWLEGVFSNLLTIILYISGYWLFGLLGIGVAYIIQYSIYIVILSYFTFKRYNFTYEKEIYFITLFGIIISIITYTSALIFSSYFLYFIQTLLIGTAILFSYIQLDRRIGLKEIFHGFLNRKSK
jgi:O-antigen/teichoic acid export membrane protein